MKTTVNYNDFYNAFMSIRPDNFSNEGLYALFEYLTDLEDDMGEEFELDVIGLCCDFAEYPAIEDVIADYPDITTLEQLQDEAIVIEFETGIIIGQF